MKILKNLHSLYSPIHQKHTHIPVQCCHCLTHALTRLLSVIDGNPGITEEAVASIKKKIEESDHPLLFSLMLDEMSIKTQIEWDGKQYVGFVNLGTNLMTLFQQRSMRYFSFLSL